MQIPHHPLLLLPQPPLRLLQIFRYISTSFCPAGIQERLGLGGVVRLGRSEEGRLELLFVDVEALLVGVGRVKAERDERVDDFFDEGLVDGGAVALGGDEAENGGGEWGLEGREEVLAPLSEGELATESELYSSPCRQRDLPYTPDTPPSSPRRARALPSSG
jgi:hypothetical protein